MKKLLFIFFILSGIALAQFSTYNKQIVRGDKAEITWTYSSDISSYEIIFVVKASRDAAAGEFSNRLIQKKNTVAGGSDSQLTAVYSTQTTITVKLLPEDTQDLQAKTYYYDIIKRDHADTTDSRTIFSGNFTLIADVQTPFDGLDLPLNATRVIPISSDTLGAYTLLSSFEADSAGKADSLKEIISRHVADSIANSDSLNAHLLYMQWLNDRVKTDSSNKSDSLIALYDSTGNKYTKSDADNRFVHYTDSSSALGWYRRAYFDAVIANINLNVALKANIAAPTFTGKITTDSLKLNNLTSGYLPYQDATRFRNSNISTLGAYTGIGTMAPGQKLHVAVPGATSFSPGLLLDNPSGSAGASSGLLFRSYVGTTASDRAKGGIAFEYKDTYGRGALCFLTDNTADNSNANINDVRMTILNDGNAGIGTTDLDGTPAIGRVTIKASANNGTSNILVGRNSTETNVFRVNDKGSIFRSGGEYVKTLNQNDGYIPLSNDYFITYDETGGSSLVFMTAGVEGQHYIFVKSDASAETVQYIPDGSQTINFTTDYTLTAQGQVLNIIFSNGNWYKIN